MYLRQKKKTKTKFVLKITQGAACGNRFLLL